MLENHQRYFLAFPLPLGGIAASPSSQKMQRPPDRRMYAIGYRRVRRRDSDGTNSLQEYTVDYSTYPRHQYTRLNQ
jgi:hypothetical protein